MAPPAKRKTGLLIGIAAACLALAVGEDAMLSSGRSSGAEDTPSTDSGDISGGGPSDPIEIPDSNDPGQPVTIAGQEFFLNDERVEIPGGALTDEDIQTILQMSNLATLNIQNCQAADYSFLARLPSLREIYFNPQSGSDLSYLSGLKNLTRISCSENSWR